MTDVKQPPRRSRTKAAARSGTGVPHFTPTERAARGKAARTELPRSAHANWEPLGHRPDPVALLEEQAETRLPELVPIRHGRMLVSPFTSFRGAAYLMAADLADGPRTGLFVQLCGDAHLSNFGFSPRPTGGSSSASTTSTRHSEAVRVGRETARGELCRRRTRSRLRRC